MAATTSQSDGTSPFDPTAFEHDVYGIGTSLESAFNSGLYTLGHIADLIVSDWGRLQAANAKILAPQDRGGWGIDTNLAAKLTSQLETSIAAYLWRTLLPVPLDAIGCWAGNTFCDIIGPIPADDQFPYVLGVVNLITGDLTKANASLFKGDGQAGFVFPDSGTLSTLFGPNGLGLQPLYFLAPAAFDPKTGQRFSPGFAYPFGG